MTDYADTVQPGLGVRVNPSGRKAFYVRYSVGRRRVRMTLGAYPALTLSNARRKAREVLGRVAMGEDPQGDKHASREAVTFGELATEYFEKHSKAKKRSWQEDARILRKDLLPAWRHEAAGEIGRRQVGDLLDRIVDRGAPIMANRLKALISKIYAFGLSRDLIDHNPCHGVPMPAKARQRERVLSDDEIRALSRALDELPAVTAATYKIRILTAQRGKEVFAMRWEQIEDGWWTIPADVAKNGHSHRVPLAPQTIALLEELRPVTGHTPWVFASPRKTGTAIGHVQKATERERLQQISGLDFVAHDLRRTAATTMASMGVVRLVIKKILNHVDSDVTAIYDRHSYDGEKREALVMWADKLEAILAEGDLSADTLPTV